MKARGFTLIELVISIAIASIVVVFATMFIGAPIGAYETHSRRAALVADTSGERQPLSFAQQRLWFLWNLEPDSSMYNMPGALRLRGELNLDALRRTFETLVQRHAVLRTTFYE